MFLAIVLGVVVGVIGYLPYIFAKRQSRKTDPANALGYTGWFFFAILVSFVVLFAGVIICAFAMREQLLAFAVTEIVVLFVLVMFFGLVKPKMGN